MLKTRLWMGAILVVLTTGVLVLDRSLAPWHPFLFGLIVALALIGGQEIRNLLDETRRSPAWLILGGLLAVLVGNWVGHVLPTEAGSSSSPWDWVAGTFAAFVLSAFLREMAVYREPGQATVRLALATWSVAYLGVLPSFLVQLRWLPDAADHPGVARGTLALALAIFVPKFCDVGAYFTGRFLGRHKMTPVLSPKKTWEGFGGGMAASVATTFGIDALGPVFPSPLATIGFGLSVGVAGVIGDLAESLIKRDCEKKDASQVVPGFGGVLDVVDSIVFAAPVVYWWLRP